MRWGLIIWGLIIGGAGYTLNYYSLFENPEILYGIMGVGVLLILVGLFMKKKY